MAKLSIPMHISGELLEALSVHTGIFWSDFRMEPVIEEAIRAWLNPAPTAAHPSVGSSAAGYQWKQVFLPEGTQLRASFGPQTYFAMVERMQIKYESRNISPSAFANLHGSGNRNAWNAIWLCFPAHATWLRATVCRAACNAMIARLLAAPMPAACAQI